MSLCVLQPAAAAEPTADQAAAEAEAVLLQAKLAYQRGDFVKALLGFASLLTRPVKLTERQSLHEAYVYYGFTQLLMDDRAGAREQLEMAVRIDRDYRPSPVTTRPDLVMFYGQVRDEWLVSHPGDPEILEEIFPELKTQAGLFQRRVPFVPVAGRGLAMLGHKRAGDALLAVEVGTGALDVAAILTIVALLDNRSRAATTAAEVAQGVTYFAMPTFYTALAVDIISSVALFTVYQRNPGARPHGTPVRAAALPSPARVQVGPGELQIRF